MSEITVEAKSLRSGLPIKLGIYKWYAPEETLKKLCKDFPSLIEEVENDEKPNSKLEYNGRTYYLVYIGTAKYMQRRLLPHVNSHTSEDIENSTISTLRQSISSLIAGNQNNNDDTNNIIDTMLIKYECFDNSLGTLEEDLIKQYNPILNIQHNKPNSPEKIRFKNYLRRLRTSAREVALKELKSIA